MGLDASVYRDDECEQKIASVRIGNVAMIGYLRKVIQEHVPSASVLLTKVLYSGSRCGDALTTEDVPRAKLELSEVQRSLSGDPDVKQFINGFGTIVDTAMHHDRPITF